MLQTSDFPPFTPFASIPRLSRDMVVTEKLDGTNASILITEDGKLYAGSRNRWLTPEADNYGFAKWVAANAEALLALGPGHHFGEWWGQGIQRGYGLTEKRFSLFNTGRWHSEWNESRQQDRAGQTQCTEVPVCHVVPLLDVYGFDTDRVDEHLRLLAEYGSAAAPGFMRPEGVVVYHVKSGQLFKKTLDKNDGHKGG